MSRLQSIKETVTHVFSSSDTLFCERCHQITEHTLERISAMYGGPIVYRCRVCGMGKQSW